MKKFLRILLYTLLAIVVLAGGFALFIQVRGIPRYEAKDPGFKVDATAAKIAEGKRIASMLCKECHFNPQTAVFSGKSMPEVKQFGEINSANITGDKEYGIGSWTDGQLAYYLRTGIRKDGYWSAPWMPKFVNLSNEDLEAVIAFVRSDDPWLKPTKIASVPVQPSFFSKFLSFVAFKPDRWPETPIPSPDTSKQILFGKYLVTGKFDCYPCHSKDFATMNTSEPEKSEGFMGGGNTVGETPGGHKVLTSNLTSDNETGIGRFTLEEFDKAMRSGIRPDGTTNRQPMLPYTRMTDQEVAAIYAYLKSIPKIVNKVPRELDK